MLQTQVNYWNLVEARRHNYEQEAIGRAQAEAQMRTANANLQNAVSNALTAQANWQNAQTNAFVAEYQQDLGYKTYALSARKTASDISLNGAYIQQAGARAAESKANTLKTTEETKFVPMVMSSQANYNYAQTDKVKHDIISGYINAGSNALNAVSNLIPLKFSFGL